MKKLKLDPKWLLIIGLGLYVFFLQECSSNKDKVVTEQTTIESDTSRVTYVDTITFVDTVVRTVIVKVNKPVRVTVVDTLTNDSIVRDYENDFSDSLLDGSVWTQVNGTLIDQKINYIAKFPQYIIQTDTVIINTRQTTTKLNDGFSLNLGIEVGGNEEKFNFSPLIGFSTKNRNSYSYRYGVLDKTHSVGIMYNIKFKK